MWPLPTKSLATEPIFYRVYALYLLRTENTELGSVLASSAQCSREEEDSDVVEKAVEQRETSGTLSTMVTITQH